MSDISKAHEVVLREGWLSLTPPSFQREILAKSRLRDYKSGEWVYRVNEPPSGMFGLVSGGLGLFLPSGGEDLRFAHFSRPGAWFGEMSVITDAPRWLGTAVTRDSQLLQLPLAAIYQVVDRNPQAWRFFALATVDHFNTAMGMFSDLLIRDHLRRFIATLLRLAGVRDTCLPGTGPIEVDVSQDKVAALANVARTTAGAILRHLEATGHVEQLYGRIRIVAPYELKGILDEVHLADSVVGTKANQPGPRGRIDEDWKSGPPDIDPANE